MTDINDAAAAARENARTHSGQFGEQEHSAPELNLSPAAYSPGQPVHATVIFQVFASEHDDHPVEFITKSVDIAPAMNAMHLSKVQQIPSDPWTHGDQIVMDLYSVGDLTPSEHPFELSVTAHDLAPYLAYRESLGKDEPVAERVLSSRENLTTVLSDCNATIASLRQQLAQAETEKEEAEQRILRALAREVVPGASQIVVQLDHHRYPVEVYDADGKWVNLGEEGEQRLVDEIRAALGEDPATVGGRGTARVVDINDA